MNGQSMAQVLKHRLMTLSLGAIAGVAATVAAVPSAVAFEMQSERSVVAAALPESPQAGAPRVASGVYVFGDTPEPNQLGHEYMVLQVDGNDVMGAFYQPASEFSCFSGNVTPDQLTLQVQETYGGELSSYSVPLYLNNQVAASEFVMPYENALGLQGTYRMDGVDEISQRILDICRADAAQDKVQ